MTKLDTKKGFFETVKFVGGVLTIFIVGITSALFTAIKDNDFSLWVFVGLFVDVFLVIATIILVFKMTELSEDMEDLK